MKTTVLFVYFLFNLFFFNYSYSQYPQTRIPDLVFEQYLIDQGYDSGDLDGRVLTANIENVTFLDLSNTNVNSLIGLQDFTALTSLNVSSTSISSLDLRSNIALTNLYATNTVNLDCITVANATAATTGTGIYTNWLKDLTCGYSETCRLTYVPDDVFEEYLIYNGYDAGPLDDYVATAIIENVTTVSLFYKNVYDITGIEDFTALTNLNVAYTHITSLDVSNNTVLTHLEAGGISISSLDVSNNTVLEYLKLVSSSITSLDLGAITTLTYLNVASTALSSLDVSNNTALTNLEVWQCNSLSSLDVSNNIALTNLSASSTGINSLDLSNNIALTNLSVSSTSITSLDISNNTALTSLWANGISIISLDVSNNTLLTNLRVSDTELTNLDMSNNTLLRTLYVSNTPLITLNISNTAITSLNVSNTPSLITLNVSNTVLIYLNVYRTRISSLDLSTITTLIRLHAYGTWWLNCIDVADATAATAGTGIYASWLKDANCSYSEDCSNLSVLDFDVSTVYIGPNPIKNELQIELNNVAILKEVILFNVSGKQILSSINSSISTSYLQAGIYFVKIITDKGHFTKKLIKM